MSELTIKERESIRQNALKIMRQRLEERKPEASQYNSTDGKDSRFIASVLTYSRAAIPVIALLAGIASAVRTLQVVSSIYSAAGSPGLGVIIASISFTLAAEGALFVLALAQAGEELRARSSARHRHVTSLASLWRAFLVRLGKRPALRHDELPEKSGGIGFVILLALLFTLSTNLYLGLKPLVDELGASSLQDFFAGLWSAPANIQLTAVVDIAAALFAPLMAFTAGHLTARFAAEIAEQSQAVRGAYERDLNKWRDQYANPLETDEGRELLEEYMKAKLDQKTAKRKPVEVEVLELPLLNGTYHGNGHSAN